jgi:hypothetical protein
MAATARLNHIMPQFILEDLADTDKLIKQKDLTFVIEKDKWSSILAASQPIDSARILAFNQEWADGWLQATPSQTFDTLLSNVVVRDIISLRLGIDIYLENHHCPSCHIIMDPRGHH